MSNVDLNQVLQETRQGSTSTASNIAGDLGVNLAGGVGGSIGQVFGPIGGAVGGGLTQGAAEAIRELMSGKGLNAGQILSQGGQGAVWGAIPGGEEARTVETGAKLLGEAGAKDVVESATKGLVEPAIKSTATWGAKQLGKRALLGAGAGMGAQSIQDISQGKNPLTDPNVLTQGGIGGSLNALAPGLSKILGIPTKWMFGSSEEINNTIANHLMGSSEEAMNPLVRENLVPKGTTDLQTGMKTPAWLASANSLDAKAKEIYNPLIKVLKGKQANINEFLATIREGMNQPGLHGPGLDKETIGQKMLQIEDFIKSKGGRVGDPRTKISGDVIHDVKYKYLKPLYEDAPAAYRNATDFIKQIVGNDANTQKITDDYHALSTVADRIRKKLAVEPGAKAKSVNKPMNMMLRLLGIGGPAALAKLLGVSVPGGIYSGGAATIPIMLNTAKNLITDSPEMGTKYADVLKKIEPSIRPLIQQLLLRGGQLGSNVMQGNQLNSPTPTQSSGQFTPNPNAFQNTVGQYPIGGQ